MVVKEIIGILLLSGSLQILASDNIDKSSELDMLHDVQLKHLKNSEKKFTDPSLQIEEDDYKQDDKKHLMQQSKKFKGSSDYMKLNEIDSKEYVDKYNKYGKYNAKVAYMEKDKAENHQKHASESEKHFTAEEKPRTLLRDLDINYALDDLKVNYVNNKKQISQDSEWIFESTSANTVPRNKEKYVGNYQNGKEWDMKRSKKSFYQNLSKIDLSNPPDPNNTVLMARYIVHTVDWAALATISGRASSKGSPFACVKATSDGMYNASSGIPFFYVSPLDLCTQDFEKDNRISVLVTLSETDYCRKKKLDPQDPRCGRLTLSGKIKRIKRGSDEEKFARSALFSRHPDMESWPSDHSWYFTKLKIGEIILLDQFGGAKFIKVKDYLNAKTTEPELKEKLEILKH